MVCGAAIATVVVEKFVGAASPDVGVSRDVGVSLVTDTDVEGVVITDLDLLDREVWSRPFVTRSATAGETTVFTGVVVGLHAIVRLDVVAMLRAVEKTVIFRGQKLYDMRRLSFPTNQDSHNIM